MTLGGRILEYRTARGMSQLALSEALGVSRQSVSKWETDASVPELDKLVAMSEMFGVSLDELVRGVKPAAAEPEPAPPAEQQRSFERRQIVGIILLDDIRTDMFDHRKYKFPISKYITQPPDVILKNEMISEVVGKFEESHAWNLPVVDKKRKYLGFVSKSSILAAYRQQLVELTEE